MPWSNYCFDEPKFPSITNPTILAFSCYFHDSSACILKNGEIIAAVDEERFSRKKHDASFPIHSIKYCLKVAEVEKVDLVVFYENPDVKWERIKDCIHKNPPTKDLLTAIENVWSRYKSKVKIQEFFRKQVGLENEILFLDHHLCHAASSYLVSPFKQSAVVVIDGVGERVTTSYGVGLNNNLQLSKCINFPDSIGLFYTAITVFLGFNANDHEYKVMGLAAYGDMNRSTNSYYSRLSNLIKVESDGSFSLNMKYFGHECFGTPAYTEALIDLLDLKPNSKGGAITKDHQDLAAALQLLTEETVLHVLNHVQKETQMENLCFSGGVALNSVLNGKILSHTGFKKLFIQPSAGDGGSVIGAVKYAQFKMEKLESRQPMIHSSYGPHYKDYEIKAFLEEKGIVYTEFKTANEMLDQVSLLLKENSVVGWFQGKMEWGPRALGNRSILASPIGNEMQGILNEKVKHRELFRPFAPVVCVDDAEEYFECDSPIPEPTDYMLMVYPIRQNKRSKIPAVTHVDGTGRLQTIRKHQNPLYYDLIKKFGKLTGTPILVNTSFNVRGEPIVCKPSDAYRCMMGTQIDNLVMGNFLISRKKNIKDAWELTIKD